MSGGRVAKTTALGTFSILRDGCRMLNWSAPATVIRQNSPPVGTYVGTPGSIPRNYFGHLRFARQNKPHGSVSQPHMATRISQPPPQRASCSQASINPRTCGKKSTPRRGVARYFSRRKPRHNNRLQRAFEPRTPAGAVVASGEVTPARVTTRKFASHSSSVPLRSRQMLRPLLWLLIVGGVLLSAGPALLSPETRPVFAGHSWRRTSAGWERQSRWQAPEHPRTALLHPASLASLQLAFSMLALSGPPSGSRRFG